MESKKILFAADHLVNNLIPPVKDVAFKIRSAPTVEVGGAPKKTTAFNRTTVDSGREQWGAVDAAHPRSTAPNKESAAHPGVNSAHLQSVDDGCQNLRRRATGVGGCRMATTAPRKKQRLSIERVLSGDGSNGALSTPPTHNRQRPTEKVPPTPASTAPAFNRSTATSDGRRRLSKFAATSDGRRRLSKFATTIEGRRRREGGHCFFCRAPNTMGGRGVGARKNFQSVVGTFKTFLLTF